MDTCWRFAKKNTGPDNGKFPWIDLWGKKHSSNATRFKLYLAFDCKEFKAEQPVEHNKIMRALSEENVKERSKENKATWAAAQATTVALVQPPPRPQSSASAAAVPSSSTRMWAAMTRGHPGCRRGHLRNGSMLPLSARHLTMGNDHAGRSVPSKYAQRPDESCGGAERGGRAGAQVDQRVATSADQCFIFRKR